MSQTPEHDRLRHDAHHDDDDDADRDAQLLARLRVLDPAADLPPLPDDTFRALLGATMSTSRSTGDTTSTGTTTTSTDHQAPQSATVTSLADARRRRRRWVGAAGLGLAAAAAGVIAVGAGLPGLGGDDPRVTALQAPSSGGLTEGACAPVDETFLAGRDQAFEGRVTEVRSAPGGEVVVLDVERVFQGDVGERVEVSTPGAGSQVDGSVQLVQGQEYLVAAFDGNVSGCGATGPVSPELEALYEQAYGGGS